MASIDLNIPDDVTSVRLLTAAECAYVAALDTPLWAECDVNEPSGSAWRRLCFYLFSVLLVLILLVLTPIDLPSPLASTALALRLVPASNPQVSPPNNDLNADAEREIITGEQSPLSSEPNIGVDDTSAASSTADKPAGLSTSILQSKAAVLQAWSEANVDQNTVQLGDYRGQGSVFDSRLNTRLSHLAPGRLPAAVAPSTLADVNGMQQVVLGDHCFQVTKLDDQAMRGMGVWTRGQCHTPNKYREEIKIGVLP